MAHAKPTRLVMDCDPGTDDTHALLMALAHSKRVELVALTITFGNTLLKNTAKNALRILKFAGRLDIPVYKGSEWSIIGTEAVDEGYHGQDGMGDITLDGVDPVDTSALQPLPAAWALCKLVNKHPGTITLLATGPLTNIATAIGLDGCFGSKLKDCIIMGGNLNGRGNVSPTAEFNFYSDPEAAQCVLSRLGRTITLLPMDTCKQHSFSMEWYDDVLAPPTRNAAFMKSIEAGVVAQMRASQKDARYTAWDQLAMAVVIDPRVVMETNNIAASVELSGRLTRGQMVVGWTAEALAESLPGPNVQAQTQNANVRLVTKLDLALYEAIFRKTVAHDFTPHA